MNNTCNVFTHDLGYIDWVILRFLVILPQIGVSVIHPVSFGTSQWSSMKGIY